MTEQFSLGEVSTKALCAELAKRQAVRVISATFPSQDKIWISAEPPCTIFVVTD